MKFFIDETKLNKLTLHFDGKVFYGAYQEWYTHFWQRMAGCGPCCASNLLACIDQKTTLTPKQNCVQLIHEVWKFVTPGLRGLNKIENFVKGSERYFSKRKMPYKCKSIHCVPQDKKSFDDSLTFVINSLKQNNPVAFLNLSNGEINQLERWHWVTVVGVEQTDSDVVFTVFDADQTFEMSFAKWHSTAEEAGGFVCFEKY